MAERSRLSIACASVIAIFSIPAVLCIIATVIVLSLIPIYLPSGGKSSTSNLDNRETIGTRFGTNIANGETYSIINYDSIAAQVNAKMSYPAGTLGVIAAAFIDTVNSKNKIRKKRQISDGGSCVSPLGQSTNGDLLGLGFIVRKCPRNTCSTNVCIKKCVAAIKATMLVKLASSPFQFELETTNGKISVIIQLCSFEDNISSINATTTTITTAVPITKTTTNLPTTTTTDKCIFHSPLVYPINGGSFPRSVTVDDMDGDGKPDIIVTNTALDNATVLFNKGSNMFIMQPNKATDNGASPYFVATGDINGDKKPDIAVANYDGDNIGILINKGDGTFFSQAIYSMSIGSSPRFVTLIDANGDSKLDIVVANSGADNIGIFINKGDGTYFPQVTYSMGTGSSPRSVSTGDVNGDNIPDIVVANFDGNNVVVLFNQGNGAFLIQGTYSTNVGSSPNSVIIVDVDGNKKSDIIVANSGGDNIGVLINKGDGTFHAQKTYSTGKGTSPMSLVSADINGDTKNDIIVANSGKDNVGILLNNGDGSFFSKTTYSTGTGSYPICVTAADMNADSKPDIIVANYGLDNVNVILAC
ncbi:unnamed protein product [Adineta ricciae]|uniref:Uncharacterized protein n=1 Tax=Adineta ricciae TaxID=249248 RepID=A0A815PJV2_ADIRI|nr:unnamed protein product [Adineta ricciae]CAF1449897.1 unnamed protein product [Adineta ricciae]